MAFVVRICLISREYPPDTGWGGIGAYTFQHAQALKNLGHDVEVISLTKEDARADSSSDQIADPSLVPVHRAVWGNLLQELSTVWISVPYTHFVLKSALALWRKFLEVHSVRPFDLVEAPEHLAEALFPAITRVCPLVIRLHTPHSKFIREKYHNLNAGFDHRLVSILERMAMIEADLLSSPSIDLASYVASDTGVEPAEIRIVRNPVDTKRFCPNGPKALSNSDGPLIFFAGRLEERKGVHYLIDAVPAVLAKVPNAKFVIVGADTKTGPGKTSVLAELHRRLAASGCAQAVQFVNHVPLAEMPNYYRSADICVVPSLYENAPYTVLEAQSTGKPVIGTSAGGSPEYVAHDETGLVVPPRDSHALAEAIVDLSLNKDKREAMAKRARERSLSQFDREIIAQHAIASYEFAIEQYKSEKPNALFKKSSDQSLRDFVEVLYAYHNSLCDLIYRHSLSYRAKYWIRNFAARPRLCAAKLAAAALERTPILSGQTKIILLVDRLKSQIASREQEQQNQVLEALLKSCNIQVPGQTSTRSASTNHNDNIATTTQDRR